MGAFCQNLVIVAQIFLASWVKETTPRVGLVGDKDIGVEAIGTISTYPGYNAAHEQHDPHWDESTIFYCVFLGTAVPNCGICGHPKRMRANTYDLNHQIQCFPVATVTRELESIRFEVHFYA